MAKESRYNHNKHDLKVGQNVILDKTFNNSSMVRILEFTPLFVYAMVQSIDENNELIGKAWQTMTNRLTPITTHDIETFTMKSKTISGCPEVEKILADNPEVANMLLGYCLTGKKIYNKQLIFDASNLRPKSKTDVAKPERLYSKHYNSFAVWNGIAWNDENVSGAYFYSLEKAANNGYYPEIITESKEK